MAKGGRRVRIFSALEVANICGVVNQTAINWIRSGHLKAFTTPGGQYRIYAKDLAAFLDKRGMSASGEVLRVMMENANWDTFLIAADQSVAGAVKHESGKLFPHYAIIQAFDWFEIGRQFAEKRPGLVLLDAELPGVDVSRFLRATKEDPALGKPYVILLTDGSYDSQEKPDAVLEKPLDIGKLAVILKSLEKQADSTVSA